MTARQTYLRSVLERIRNIVSVSNFHRDSMINLGIAPEVLTVCENPIAPFEVSSNGRHAPGERLRFVYLGGPTLHKGFHLLREAVQQLEGPWELRYYGFNLSRRAYWRGRLFAAGRWRKEIFGPRYRREDLPRILEKADVVIVPSVMLESFSLVCREALLLGCPVLASRSGGPEEAVIPRKNGWLFRRGDALDLRATLRQLCAQPDLVREAQAYLAEHPFEWFSLEDYGATMERVLKRACGE